MEACQETCYQSASHYDPQLYNQSGLMFLSLT